MSSKRNASTMLLIVLVIMFKRFRISFCNFDDYYVSILAKESFDGNYQMYTCRGDKEKNMYITNYLEKIKLYLIALIDEKKIFNQKYNLT